jgi:hypothetical protein
MPVDTRAEHDGQPRTTGLLRDTGLFNRSQIHKHAEVSGADRSKRGVGTNRHY